MCQINFRQMIAWDQWVSLICLDLFSFLKGLQSPLVLPWFSLWNRMFGTANNPLVVAPEGCCFTTATIWWHMTWWCPNLMAVCRSVWKAHFLFLRLSLSLFCFFGYQPPCKLIFLAYVYLWAIFVCFIFSKYVQIYIYIYIYIWTSCINIPLSCHRCERFGGHGVETPKHPDGRALQRPLRHSGPGWKCQ